MAFWNVENLSLEVFRPGIMSRAEFGSTLVMACMEIAPNKEDTGHEHPFDQCGVVLQGIIEMTIGKDKKVLHPQDAYFIPSGEHHGWKTFDVPAKILDIAPRQA